VLSFLWNRSLLFTLLVVSISTASFAQANISVSFGPPALPVNTQPTADPANGTATHSTAAAVGQTGAATGPQPGQAGY
jgi:hypothetical protein